MTEDKPQLLASPAPVVDEVDDMPTGAEELIQQKDLDMLCNAWSSWVRSRRLYVKPSAPVSLLGKLTTKSSGRSQSDGPNAIASAELMAFHLALLGQPAEALDRRVFELHYFWGVRNIKAAASELGISRQHWYRLVSSFRARVYLASRDILESNLTAAASLPSTMTEKV